MTTLRDVERLASTLDAANDTDRATLHAVFAPAGQAVAREGDVVSGFSIVYQMPGGAGGTSGFEYRGSVSMGDASCFQASNGASAGPEATVAFRSSTTDLT